MLPLVTITLFVPLLGATLLVFMRGSPPRFAHAVGIVASGRARSYVALFLLMETACLGVFVALDAILFYVFFEVTLVGMYFIIAGWGYENRQRAALTFFLYTLLGSLPLLLAIIALYLGSEPNTFAMREIIANPPLAGLAATL